MVLMWAQNNLYRINWAKFVTAFCKPAMSVLQKKSLENGWLMPSSFGAVFRVELCMLSVVLISSVHVYSDLRRNYSLYYSGSCVVFAHVDRACPKQRSVSVKHNSDLGPILSLYFFCDICPSEEQYLVQHPCLTVCCNHNVMLKF